MLCCRNICLLQPVLAAGQVPPAVLKLIVLCSGGFTFWTPPSSTPSSPKNCTLSGLRTFSPAFWTCSSVSCTKCCPRRTCRRSASSLLNHTMAFRAISEGHDHK